MRRGCFLFLIIAMYFICFSLPAQAVVCPEKGDSFPELKLPVPENAAEKNYLGLQGKGSFKVSQIKSDAVIVEIFSMYCPYCQKEAPVVNRLFQAIEKRGLKDKIKIIGVGAGNTPFEVDFFKNQYAVPFPLFPDESFDVHKAIGDVRTPYFFVFKLYPDGSNKIVYSKAGSIQDPNQFLDLIIKEAGL